MPGCRKDVERVHVGRADDAENIGHPCATIVSTNASDGVILLYALGDGAVRLLHIGHRYPRLGDATVYFTLVGMGNVIAGLAEKLGARQLIDINGVRSAESQG